MRKAFSTFTLRANQCCNKLSMAHFPRTYLLGVVSGLVLISTKTLAEKASPVPPKITSEARVVCLRSGDIKNGSGVIQAQDGSIYNGSWVGSRMVDGTLETADCHIKLFHGYGDIAYPNGEKYRGKLNEVDGSAEGKGMLLAPMGPFNRMEVLYDGEFRDSKFHGRGVLYETASYFLYLKKWKLYEGEFEEGKYHGHGKKYEYSQFGPDVVYEGTFVQGQMEGWVVVRQNQAIIRVERWENGQCVEAKPHP